MLGVKFKGQRTGIVVSVTMIDTSAKAVMDVTDSRISPVLFGQSITSLTNW